MTRSLLQAAILTGILSTVGISAAASAGHGLYAKPDRLADFAEIHGFEHPSVAAAAQSAVKPRLGVSIAAVGQSDLDAMSLEYGVRIERMLPDSIAAGIGLKAGDVVTAIGDRPAYSPERMQYLISIADSPTTITLSRAGRTLTLPVDFTPTAQPTAGDRAALGIRIQNMTRALKEAFGAEDDNGVLIAQVNTGSAAEKAGLKAGDVVVAIGDRTVQETGDVLGALATRAPGDEVRVTILRDRAESDATVALGGAADAMVPGKALGQYAIRKGHGEHGYGHPRHGRYGKSGGSWHGHCERSADEKTLQQGPF
jgi:S1-C subfamily serine protease